MKALFSHDHMFFKYNDIFYSNGGLSYTVLKRYIDVFENITVISRQLCCEKSNQIRGLTLASGEGVDFVAVPNFKSLKKITLYKKAIQIIENEVKNSDIIIARVPSSISYLVIRSAIKYNKPYLVEVVGCAWDANKNHGSLVGKFLAPYSYLKMRSIIKNAPYVIYITKEFLQKRYPNENITTVCPNVKIEEVSIDVLENRLEKIRNPDTEEKIKLGLIGSLDVNYKGHDTVILDIKRLKEMGFDVKVEFVGKGDNTRWVNLAKLSGVEDNIIFKGSLPSGSAIYSWIDSLDMMVQPSYAEAQGRSIIEGMSRGCPIIATRVGGIVELINHDLLIKAGDYDDLAEKIKKLIQNRVEMEKSSIENFNEAKQYYNNNIEAVRYSFLTKYKEDNNG